MVKLLHCNYFFLPTTQPLNIFRSVGLDITRPTQEKPAEAPKAEEGEGGEGGDAAAGGEAAEAPAEELKVGTFC